MNGKIQVTKRIGKRDADGKASVSGGKRLPAGCIEQMERDVKAGRTCFVLVGFDPHTMDRLRLAVAWDEAGTPADWIREQLVAAVRATEEGVEDSGMEEARDEYCNNAGLPPDHPLRRARLCDFGEAVA